MNKATKRSGLVRVTNRREAIALLGGGASLLAAALASGPVRAEDDGGSVLTEATVHHDPDVPVAGNPNGDITIAEWSDYQCPYCRKVEPELRQVVQRDGKIRLVLKDWPVLGPVSVTAARMALASKFQDKYHAAHDTMMAAKSKLTEPMINELLAKAGIDMDRLKSDLSSHGKEIDAILARNNAQAIAFGFRGTPAFIVGHFRVPGALTAEQFEQAIADARKAKANTDEGSTDKGNKDKSDKDKAGN